jgi:hypothetical protein
MKGLKNAVAVVAMLAIVGFGYLSLSSAEEGKSIEQMIAEAKTPADHEAIAAWYEKEAQAAHQEHAKHKKLRDLYVATPTKSATLATHCDAAAKKYEEIAKEYEAMAHTHRDMAKQAQ